MSTGKKILIGMVILFLAPCLLGALQGLPSTVTLLLVLGVPLFFLARWATPRLRQASARAAAERATQQAERDRIEANRRAALEHAEQIAREQKFQERATRPGHLTGYEPADLAGIDLDALRPAHMYGSPGIGLAGAGFTEAAVKRGSEGEINFAKALAKAGLLERFATFWSVHMPDEKLGASQQFNSDIDCVIVTGTSVWLIDVKNYNQGDVSWKVEVTREPGGAELHQLLAVDNVTGGLVGNKRKMSLNMKLATERFQKRFSDTAITMPVRPAVTLMPRHDGIGTAQNLQWAGGIPLTPLPHLLAWLAKEPAFTSRQRDAGLLLALLQPLLKDASGSAPRPGQIRPAATPTTPTTPATAPASPASATASATASSPAVPVAAARTCPDCKTTVQPEWTFCESCGETL